MSLLVPILFVACDDAYEVNYDAPANISFDGVENGIAIVAKGVDNYTARIRMQAPNGISYFEISNADIKTSAKGTLIEGSNKTIDSKTEYTEEFQITNLTENKCIRISVGDSKGNITERNLVIQITPSVVFSENIIMETADDYYGSYYAGWLNGRVYLRSNGTEYAGEVDLSMGMIDINGTSTPALISPAKRGDFNLSTFTGLKDAKFELTTLTMSDYEAISKVGATPITSLIDPTLPTVEITQGKVYLFKTADGKKGLAAISNMTKRTGTIQNAGGEWVENYTYWRVNMTTKIAAQ